MELNLYDKLCAITRDALLYVGDNDSNNDKPDNEKKGQEEEEAEEEEGKASKTTIHKPIVTADLLAKDIQWTPEVRNEIYTQIYGHSPPDIAIWEDRVKELESEIWKLPTKEKAVFVKLIQINPMLFNTILLQQARLFLSLQDNDTKLAAKNIAKYWGKRQQLLTSNKENEENVSSFLPTANHNMNDFIRFYKHSEQIIYDDHHHHSPTPSTDDFAKQTSKLYIRSVNYFKTKQLDKDIITILKKGEEKNDKDIQLLLHWMKEYKLVTQEEMEEQEQQEQPEKLKQMLFQQQHEKSSPGGIKQRVQLQLLDANEKVNFIRRENFIENLAAERVIKYFQMKYELFGPTLASQKRITLKDLSKSSSCWNALQLGLIRIMPGTDAYGRTVIMWDCKRMNGLGPEEEGSVLKGLWYILHAALEELSCQRHGIVGLFNLRGCDFDYMSRVQFRKRVRAMSLDTIPTWTKAVHLFIPPIQSWWKRMMYNIFSPTGNRMHVPIVSTNVIIHAGVSPKRNEGSTEDSVGRNVLSAEDYELLDLQDVGILPDQLPTDLGGNVTFEHYLNWLENRKQKGL